MMTDMAHTLSVARALQAAARVFYSLDRVLGSAYKDGHKDAVVAAGLDASLHSTVFDIGRGSPWPPEFGGRALRNAYSDTWHGREAELRAAPVPTDEPIVWAGQVAGLVKEKRPASEVVAELADAERLLAEVCTRTTGG